MNTPQKFWLATGLLLIAATVIMPPWTCTKYKVLSAHVYPSSPFSNAPRYSTPPTQAIDSVEQTGPFQYSLMSPPWQASVNGGLLLIMLVVEAIATAVLVKATGKPTGPSASAA